MSSNIYIKELPAKEIYTIFRSSDSQSTEEEN